MQQQEYDSTLLSFFSEYGLRVSDASSMTKQSPHTLRNWFNRGRASTKNRLILCIIAAYKFRIEVLGKSPLGYKLMEVSNESKTLLQHLKPENMMPEDLIFISGQSNQTLLNWLNSTDKYPLIEVLIDARKWHREATRRKIIECHPLDNNYMAYALTKKMLMTQTIINSPLSDIIDKKNRKFKSK